MLSSAFVLIAIIAGLLTFCSSTWTPSEKANSSSSCTYGLLQDVSSKSSYSVLSDLSDLENGLDSNINDFDIFLQLTADVNLKGPLSDSNIHLSLLAPRDIAIEQTAIDMILAKFVNPKALSPPVMIDPSRPPSSNAMTLTEPQSYQTIKLFAQRYAESAIVLSTIILNHILLEQLTFCDFLNARSWETWANQTIERRGITLATGNNNFIPANIILSVTSFKTAQGFIHEIDRMMIPNLSGFKIAPTPSRTPTITPSISVSSSPASSHTPQPSVSMSPVAPSTSITPSPPPPIPSRSDFITEFSPTVCHSPIPAQATPSVTPTPTAGSRGSTGYTCFPASARVFISRNESVPMRNLQIGQKVLSSSNSDSQVFMFSHRTFTCCHKFVSIRTSQYTLTLSHGHLLYVNGRLQAAAFTQTGDYLSTITGYQVVQDVSEGWEDGLYAPHTMHGDIVVNGVITSCYTTAVSANAAHTLLTPLRALARSGLKYPIPSFLDNGVHSFLPSVLMQLVFSSWTAGSFDVDLKGIFRCVVGTILKA